MSTGDEISVYDMGVAGIALLQTEIKQIKAECDAARAEVEQAHKILDDAGIAVGSEYHGDLLARVWYLVDRLATMPRRIIDAEKERDEWKARYEHAERERVSHEEWMIRFRDELIHQQCLVEKYKERGDTYRARALALRDQAFAFRKMRATWETNYHLMHDRAMKAETELERGDEKL